MGGFGLAGGFTGRFAGGDSSPPDLGARSRSPEPSPTNGPFDIRVDNLDQKLAWKDLKRALMHAVSEVASVRYGACDTT